MAPISSLVLAILALSATAVQAVECAPPATSVRAVKLEAGPHAPRNLTLGERVPDDYLAVSLMFEESTLAWRSAAPREVVKYFPFNPHGERISRIEAVEQSALGTVVDVVNGGLGDSFVNLSFKNPCGHVHYLVTIYCTKK